MASLAPYRKGVVAALGGAATAVMVIWGPESTPGKVAQVLVAALTAAGVYFVPNNQQQ